MDQVWIMLIEAVIVAAAGVFIGWLMNNGYYSKIQGIFEAMCNTFDNFGDVIKAYDEQLYTEFEACITTLKVSFADNALTMAEFTSILKTFMPMYNRILALIAKIGSK